MTCRILSSREEIVEALCDEFEVESAKAAENRFARFRDNPWLAQDELKCVVVEEAAAAQNS
jgi:hypothetical protein